MACRRSPYVGELNKKYISFAVFSLLALLIAIQSAYALDISLSQNTPVKVYFNPKGGCTDAIIKEIDQAKTAHL